MKLKVLTRLPFPGRRARFLWETIDLGQFLFDDELVVDKKRKNFKSLSIWDRVWDWLEWERWFGSHLKNPLTEKKTLRFTSKCHDSRPSWRVDACASLSPRCKKYKEGGECFHRIASHPCDGLGLLEFFYHWKQVFKSEKRFIWTENKIFFKGTRQGLTLHIFLKIKLANQISG